MADKTDSKQKKKNTADLFYGLNEAVLAEFSGQTDRVTFKQGERIVQQKHGSDSVFYILKGRIEISKELEGPESALLHLAVMETGDIFGAMADSNEVHFSATKTALEDVELLEIPHDTFIQMSQAYPQMMFNQVRLLSKRLLLTNEKYSSLMQELISANRLKTIGMAASKIIHDIKSPLTVIVLTAQLIESIFPDSAEFTESIVKQTRLVDELVRETLDYASGTQSTPNMQKVDLDAFLNNLKETYGASLKGRDIDLRVENRCADDVYFDAVKIRRVILNLLKNSSEALEDKGEIMISASISANWLQISVTDTGPGVQPSIVEDLFKPFVSYGKPNGTGLGLSICSKLVEEHQGRLEYQPIQPHGSRFDIRIPQNLK